MILIRACIQTLLELLLALTQPCLSCACNRQSTGHLCNLRETSDPNARRVPGTTATNFGSAMTTGVTMSMVNQTGTGLPVTMLERV
jgi:hypothetical protein